MQWIILQAKGGAYWPKQSRIGMPSHWRMNADPLFTATQCGQILRTDCAPGSIAKQSVQQVRLHVGIEQFFFVALTIRTSQPTKVCVACSFVAFGDSFDVRFFISLHSATAAHNLLLLMQLFRHLVESPVLGTACLEQPAAHSLKIHLPERRMDNYLYHSAGPCL